MPEIAGAREHSVDTRLVSGETIGRVWEADRASIVDEEVQAVRQVSQGIVAAKVSRIHLPDLDQRSQRLGQAPRDG